MTDGDFDLIVLGLGPGGEEVAESAAKAGRRVLGVDPSLVGGECPYFGCIPSKMVLRGAEVLAEAGRVNGLAGSAHSTPDFTPVADRIRDEATDDWNDQVAVDRFEKLGGTFVRGAGRLRGRDEDGGWSVDVAGSIFRARDVVIATGTAPALPPIPGLKELHQGGVDGAVWTNREAVRTRAVPASLIVLGGGAIGCELAQGFARFGANVRIVESAPRLLGPEEPEAAKTIADVFAREGIEVDVGAQARRVWADDGGVHVELAGGGTAGEVVSGDKLLVATGRRTNLADIGLETAGLDPQAKFLDVDDRMQVLADGDAVAGLHAVGDITGRGLFTHVAVWQAHVLLDQLLGRDKPFGGYQGLAWATFTDPEIGRVGQTEQQARESGIDVRVGIAQISANTRGWIHGPGNDGIVKVVADSAAGVLVGATVVAPNGGEILGLLTLAVHARVPISTLANMHYVYPTMHRAVLEAIHGLA